MDEDPEELITHYTIWRSVSSPPTMTMMQDKIRDGSIVTSPGAVGLDFEGTAYRTDIQFGAAAAREWVTSVEAHYWEKYAYTCGEGQALPFGSWGRVKIMLIQDNDKYSALSSPPFPERTHFPRWKPL